MSILIVLNNFDKADNVFVFIKDMLSRSGYSVKKFDEDISSDFSFKFENNLNKRLIYAMENGNNKICKDVPVVKPRIHRITDGHEYFDYKGYMMLHMRAKDASYIGEACSAIDVMDFIIFELGIELNEKGIYQSINTCFKGE